MLRLQIIKLLFRLLKLPEYTAVDDDKVLMFLSGLRTDSRFRDYYKRRSLALLKRIGVGVNREDYLVLLGQRLELNNLISESDSAHKIIERRKKILNNKGRGKKIK